MFQRRDWRKYFERQWKKLRGRRKTHHYYRNHAARPTPEALDARKRTAQLDALPVFTRSQPVNAPIYDQFGNHMSRLAPGSVAGSNMRGNVSRVDIRT